jgi:hypothetical protein
MPPPTKKNKETSIQTINLLHLSTHQLTSLHLHGFYQLISQLVVVEIHGVIAVKITQTKNVNRIPIRWPNFDPRASFRLFFSNPHKNTAKEIKLPVILTNARTLHA